MKNKEDKVIYTRGEEITQQYFNFLDKHINDVIAGRTSEFMELNKIAGEIGISHQHLSDTIQKETGSHPCYFYDSKIIEKAKDRLLNTNSSVADIAATLTYDPSNFSKFFKKWTGYTPGNFRKSNTKLF